MSQSKVSVIDSIRTAFKWENKLPLFIGNIRGGIIPFFTFIVAHYIHPHQTAMQTAVGATFETYLNLWTPVVLGGLTVSSITVYQWCLAADRGSKYKALGTVVLTEIIMTFSPIASLAYAALALLIAVNATATACNLAEDATPLKKKAKPRARKTTLSAVKPANSNRSRKAA